MQWSDHRIMRQIEEHFAAQGWQVAASAEQAERHAGYVDGLTEILIGRGAALLPDWLR